MLPKFLFCFGLMLHCFFVKGERQLCVYAVSGRTHHLFVAVFRFYDHAATYDALFLYRLGCQRSKVFAQAVNPHSQRFH